MKNNTNFFRTFTFNIPDSPVTLKQIAKLYIVKAIKNLFTSLLNQNTSLNQIIGIILRVQFKDGSIKSISTYRKGTLQDKIKFTTLFKHLCMLRSEDYDSDQHKVDKIILSFHIYPKDYVYSLDKDDLLLNKDFMKSEDKHNVEYKTDEDNNIKYMNPLGVFKLPLAFAGSDLFKEQVLKLNTNISINHVTDDTRIKYQIVYKHINSLEVQVSFLVQDNRDIIIFNFIDKLISVPKLNANEILVERRVNSKNKQIFLIDIINPQILLIKSIDINKKGGLSLEKLMSALSRDNSDIHSIKPSDLRIKSNQINNLEDLNE